MVTKVGPSFFEYIHTEKLSSHRNAGDDSRDSSMRMGWFVGFFIAGGLILLSRLFWMQIVEGSHYRDLSDSNRIHTAIIHAPRGVIFDRNAKPLVFNVPGYRETIDGKTQLFSNAEGIGHLATGDSKLEIDSLRQYPYKDAFSQVIGYIGQISPHELSQPEMSGYKSGDLVGKDGIEQSYESLLRGLDGQSLTEVDATGKALRTLGTTDPIPGQNITLTLDVALQNATYNAMSGIAKGAAIVSKPDGEILAMVNKPSFDPNLFTMGKHYLPSPLDSYQTVSSILLDGVGQPLLNRAIAGQYPPGSTFKIVTAAAALEDKVIDANYTIEDEGILRVGSFSFANWYYTDYGRTEGTVNVVTAIKRSNDIFFYKVGSLLGVDKLSAFAQKFGLGSLLGIDLRGESSGLVPTKEWKEKTIGEQWYLGDDYHYGIGQGYLLTTPLQVNTWTQAIANGGKLYIPHLLASIKPTVKADHLLSTDDTQLIRQGMIDACSTGGVAYPLFNFSVKNPKLAINNQDILSAPQATSAANFADYRQILVACKTGTAQHGDENTKPHAWITLFAPAYHPEVVVTVLAEDSGEGSEFAAPVAKKILESYFEK